VSRRIERVELAPDVEVCIDGLVDRSLDRFQPLSSSGLLMVGELIGSRLDVEAAVDRVTATYDVDRAVICKDLHELVHRLNQAGYVNVIFGSEGLRHRGMAVFWSIYLFVTSGRMSSTKWSHRHRLQNDRAGGRLASLARAMRSTIVATVVAILAACGTAVAIGSASMAIVILIASLSGLVGLLAHEFGHATALSPRPGFIRTTKTRTAVVHRPTGQSDAFINAIAGPLPVASVGLVMLVIAAITHAVVLLAAALPLAVHVFGLAALSTDGRKIISSATHQRLVAILSAIAGACPFVAVALTLKTPFLVVGALAVVVTFGFVVVNVRFLAKMVPSFAPSMTTFGSQV
jgi:hypothetical protein